MNRDDCFIVIIVIHAIIYFHELEAFKLFEFNRLILYRFLNILLVMTIITDIDNLNCCRWLTRLFVIC